jgi:hypothetical protein
MPAHSAKLNAHAKQFARTIQQHYLNHQSSPGKRHWSESVADKPVEHKAAIETISPWDYINQPANMKLSTIGIVRGGYRMIIIGPQNLPRSVFEHFAKNITSSMAFHTGANQELQRQI